MPDSSDAQIPIDLRAVIAAGFEALARGSFASAREFFERARAAGTSDAAVWFGLAGVQRGLGAPAQESLALDEALKLDPRHLPALIAKGDLYTGLGDLRAADSYYTAVLKLAASLKSPPAAWQEELQRIELARRRFARDYEAHLLAALAGQGLELPGNERFTQAIDLLLGKRQIYFQQP